MYKHILVPLDRSDLAETALPHAAGLAEALGATISLVAVLPVLDSEAIKAAGAVLDWEAEYQELSTYLGGLCSRLAGQGLECDWEIRRGDIGEEIVALAEEDDCDLIVMSTHGRVGLSRWIYGSVADRVLTQTHVPVLVVRASEEG